VQIVERDVRRQGRCNYLICHPERSVTQRA
jgi:hypothetical protein